MPHQCVRSGQRQHLAFDGKNWDPRVRRNARHDTRVSTGCIDDRPRCQEARARPHAKGPARTDFERHVGCIGHDRDAKRRARRQQRAPEPPVVDLPLARNERRGLGRMTEGRLEFERRRALEKTRFDSSRCQCGDARAEARCAGIVANGVEHTVEP